MASDCRKLWAALYRTSEGDQRLEAAKALLETAQEGQSQVPVWLFEWLANGGFASGKKSALPEGGLALLRDLLAHVPVSYPLGPQVPWLFAQLRAAAAGALEAPLTEELLRRPALAFRPTPEQAMPLFQDAAGRYANSVAEASAAVAVTATLLCRSLAGAAAKKAFRSAVEALPAVAGILAVEGKMDPKLEDSLSALLGVLAAPEQLPGLEVLSASWERGETQKDPNDDPPKKRKRETEVYQAQLFTDLQRWLAEDSARFAKLLTRLLEAFVLGLRRQRLQEQHRKEWQRKAEGVDDKAAAGAQRTPKEFLIFDQFWKTLKPQLRGRECPSEALRSFGELWRVVRRHNLYRPREDPCGRQSKALGGSVALLLKRLQTGAPHENLSWSCLEELLALDVAPFESRLPALWAAALRGSAGASFGAALLRSYAAISDLPSCLEALVQALLQEGEDCKVDLVDSPAFLEGLEKAASQLSTPQQLRGGWELFLKHLPKDQVPVSWAPRLLGTLEPLRELCLETFSRVEGFDPPPRWLHSLLLPLCRLGRRISAFDLPPLLQKASPVAAKTLKGLEQLAATKLQVHNVVRKAEQAEAAAVLLAALQDHRHAARKKRRKCSAPEAARSLLQMKAHGGRLQLLAPTLATVLSEEGDDLEGLALRLTTQDKVAWRQLGAAALACTEIPPELSWCQDGEALLAAPALRAPLLRSLTERLQEALRDDGHEEKKPKKRKQAASPGRHEMLQGHDSLPGPQAPQAKTAYQRKFMRKVRKGFVMKNKLSVGKAGTYEKKRWKNSKVTAVVGRLPKLKITQRNIAAIGDLELNFRPGGTDLNILYFGSKKDIEGAEFEILP
ncbi:hypothetical protein AK812_SmicGene28018 [Symbiodinium microadriaticum]|uniref:Uncharacterized protein n=1 Tax=Symbiodinium microadriaticum TaxID=2951 RepID=A0A1Q9D5H1_SYMMI|nr:hypothetical protein AK812_SmicGene28018 [Symbiodinium microadriaticum]